MTDSEWKAAVFELAAKQGWDNPPTDMLARAMTQVERAMAETIGPRPTVDPFTQPPASNPKDKSLTPGEWKAFAQTLREVVERTAKVMPANIAPIARETLSISEHAALDQFYAEAHAGDRITALKHFAEIAIAREADWDPKAIREAADRHGLSTETCFGCRVDRRHLVWHHVIQIQHGGSNCLRNRVALCDCCHADVHPWLPKSARIKTGWTGVGDMIQIGRSILDRRPKGVA